MANSYNSVGTAYSHLGDYEKAGESYKQALRIRIAALPANHPDLAASYMNMGATLHQLDRNEEARTHLLKAEAIYRERPECKADLVSVYSWLSAVEAALGNDSAAADSFIKYLALKSELQS